LNRTIRPGPPERLDPEARQMWLRIVHDRPADFFSPSNLPLLEEYCAAHCATRGLWEKLHDLEPLDPDFAPVLQSALALVDTSGKLAGALGLLPEGGEWTEDDPEPEVA
jgi:phage terminase small subunit